MDAGRFLRSSVPGRLRPFLGVADRPLGLKRSVQDLQVRAVLAGELDHQPQRAGLEARHHAVRSDEPEPVSLIGSVDLVEVRGVVARANSRLLREFASQRSAYSGSAMRSQFRCPAASRISGVQLER